MGDRWMASKNIMITGASSGIGRATAILLAKQGHRLFLLARREDRLQPLVGDIRESGGRAEYYTADVRDPGRLKDITAAIADDHGSIDVLVNNAGIMDASFTYDLNIDAANECLDINVKGVINAVHAVLPGMIAQNHGHIINVSSVVGVDRVLPGLSVYSASKAAVAVFTEGLRQEMAAHYNIRVSELIPGAVATELGDRITEPELQAQFHRFKDVRFLDPEDMARGVAYMIDQPDHVSINQLQTHQPGILRTNNGR